MHECRIGPIVRKNVWMYSAEKLQEFGPISTVSPYTNTEYCPFPHTSLVTLRFKASTNDAVMLM